jgi:DNA repair exonuclease SbcCD ATPase subunit
MSREFYRRDYEPQRLSRRDSEGDVGRKQSHGTSRNRSDSRPSVPRRTTSEWQTFPSPGESLQSESSTDPRIRNKSTTTGFGAETTPTSNLPTLSVIDKLAAVAAIPASLDEPNHTVNDARAQFGVRAPADIATKAPEGVMSPVDSIASLLISFTKEAYSAAYSQLREDGAKERLTKAEKIDRQNRRIASAHGDFAAYTEQGEENMKTAAKLLEEAKKSKQEAERRSSAAAIAAATHIVELTKENNSANAEVTATTQELSEVKLQLQQTKATLTTATQELLEVKKEVQQARAGAQITSKKVDALTDFQKRELKGVSSEVAEVRLRYNDLRTDVDDVRNECGPIIQDVKFFNSDLTELRRHNERFSGLKGELGDLRKESNAIVQELKTLQTAVHDLETSRKEDKATFQDLETLQLELYNLEKRRKGSNATVQDLQSLQAIVNELSTKLSNMVDRPDFVCLSSMVESLSKQQTDSGVVNEAQQSLRKLLEPELTTIKADTQSVQKIVENMLSDRNAKENFIFDRFHSIEKSITQVRTDINKQVAAMPTPEQQDTSEVLQALFSNLRKDFALLKTESRNSVQAVNNALPGLRTAIDGNKANTHSIRALTQRWNNINTEDMVNAMLRQLERLYPHASQHQASFDALLRNLDTVRTQCHDSHTALGNRITATFAKTSQDIKDITADAKKNDDGYREHWTRVIEDVKSQRDALKSEITHDIKTLEDSHAAELASLQARIDNWKATSAADINGIAHDETSDSDAPLSRLPPARNPFATKANGVGIDKKRKRVVRLESPDLVETEGREGSAPLRAKVARKG